MSPHPCADASHPLISAPVVEGGPPVTVLARVFALFALCVAGAAQAADADSFPIDHAMGKADAKVTIIEYASTTCPHCATFHNTVLPEIKKTWIETGKARLIFRDFPTQPVGLSVAASMIAHCAGPDRYFGVLGLIFQHQDKWLSERVNPGEELKKIVRIAGITAKQVDACIARQDLAKQIQERARAGHERYGIKATPSVVIDGKLSEAQTVEQFNQALTEATAKAGGK
ncbi:MAG: DsbA family protein [Magnetospirillum sp.]|nr:DsbA family protein [Magnetospirillum sp.]